MSVNDVRFLMPYQPQESAERLRLLDRREAAHRRQARYSETLSPNGVEQGAIGAGSHDAMSTRANAPQERHEEMPQGEVDVDDFQDFQDGNGRPNTENRHRAGISWPSLSPISPAAGRRVAGQHDLFAPARLGASEIDALLETHARAIRAKAPASA